MHKLGITWHVHHHLLVLHLRKSTSSALSSMTHIDITKSLKAEDLAIYWTLNGKQFYLLSAQDAQRSFYSVSALTRQSKKWVLLSFSPESLTVRDYLAIGMVPSILLISVNAPIYSAIELLNSALKALPNSLETMETFVWDMKTID